MSERVDYTAPEVLANPLADPADPRQVDFSQRPSMFGEPELEPETGRPINPNATPDMPRGRGELWQWWVNRTETSTVLHNYAPDGERPEKSTAKSKGSCGCSKLNRLDARYRQKYPYPQSCA